MRELLEQDQSPRIDNRIVYGAFLRDFAYRAHRRGEFLLADRWLRESIQRLKGIAETYPDNQKGLYELAMAYFHYWQQNNATLPDDTAAAWLTVFRETSNHRSCSELDIESRQALITQEHDKARNLVSHLIEKGYHEPEFKRYCFEHGLCLAEGIN